MTFSLIIPIYNAGKTLRRCLDSILDQSYPSYEVWMIDDGSSDNSAEIAASYAQRDSRFILIRQPNAGPSRARNHGLNLAQGDIICFVDSDDFVEPDYLQQLSDVFQDEDVQVAFFGVNQITEGYRKECVRNITSLPENKIDQIVELTRSDLFGYTWIKAISRQCIGETRFDETLNLFEDEVFTCQIMHKLPAVSLIGKPLYNQSILPESLSRKVHRDYYDKCEAVYLAWKQLLISLQAPDHPILKDKANHMSYVCKYYFLEKKISPISFACGLAKCTFFQNATVDDALISAIKNGDIGSALMTRIIYRSKGLLKQLTGR
jgi:glycosyltransferase involved in cell wall biosynthesis